MEIKLRTRQAQVLQSIAAQKKQIADSFQELLDREKLYLNLFWRKLM